MGTNLFKNVTSRYLPKAAKCSIVCFLLMFLCLNSFGQLYFYVSSKLHTADNKPLAYDIFLKISYDWSAASARIAFKDPVTGKDRLVKQNYVNNNFPDNSNTDTILYMMPFGNAFDENDKPEKNFVIPRFQFNKTQAITPVVTAVKDYYSFNNKDWFSPQSGSFSTKSRQDLVGQNAFVKEFYGEGEDFYKGLYNIPAAGFSPDELNRNVFLIAVAATDDPEIGKTTKTDLQNVAMIFNTALYNFNFHYTKITGANFTKKAVNNAINNLKARPKDIVIFYYSGHGFRYNEDVSAFPRMALVANPHLSPDNANLGLEDIYNRILKKGALVSLVLADCCNEKYGAAPPKGPSPPPEGTAPPPPPALDLNNLRPLFIPRQKVSVLACAAEKDQLAGGNDKLGGFFTNFITNELSKSVFGEPGDGESSWAMILNNAKEYTRRQALTAPCNEGPCYQGRCLQQPDFKVIEVSGIKTLQIKK